MRTSTVGRRARRFLARTHDMGRIFLVSIGVGLVGCGGLEPVAKFEPTTDPTQLYMSLALNHRAITLSTVPGYDTLRLIATPLDATGAPIEGLPAPVFTSNDTVNLPVTPDGLLEVRGVATGVRVSVSLTMGNIKHVDTVVVNVNATSDPPPVLASLSLDPPDGDSTIRALQGNLSISVNTDFIFRSPYRFRTWTLTPVVLDNMGNPMSDIVIESVALDSAVATVFHFSSSPSSAEIERHRPGTVRMVARATAYGVTKADTVVFTVTWPLTQTVEIGSEEPGFPFVFPREVRLAPNGLVGWMNYLVSDAFDIVFDDTANVARPPAVICDRLSQLPDNFGPGEHCGTGNFIIPERPLAESTPFGFPQYWTVQVRQFPVPGVYTYHSVRAGITGRIIVSNDPDPRVLP